MFWGDKGGVVQANDGKPLRVVYYRSKTELVKNGMGHTKYPVVLSVVKAVPGLDERGVQSHSHAHTHAVLQTCGIWHA